MLPFRKAGDFVCICLFFWEKIYISCTINFERTVPNERSTTDLLSHIRSGWAFVFLLHWGNHFHLFFVVPLTQKEDPRGSSEVIMPGGLLPNGWCWYMLLRDAGLVATNISRSEWNLKKLLIWLIITHPNKLYV